MASFSTVASASNLSVADIGDLPSLAGSGLRASRGEDPVVELTARVSVEFPVPLAAQHPFGLLAGDSKAPLCFPGDLRDDVSGGGGMVADEPFEHSSQVRDGKPQVSEGPRS